VLGTSGNIAAWVRKGTKSRRERGNTINRVRRIEKRRRSVGTVY
jgi:enolase